MGWIWGTQREAVVHAFCQQGKELWGRVRKVTLRLSDKMLRAFLPGPESQQQSLHHRGAQQGPINSC